MRLEPLPHPSALRQTAPPLIALTATITIAAALAAVAGANPFAVLGQIITGAAGSKLAILETLNRATPLIFTGLAVATAFRATLWNIGAEAQLYAGAIIAVLLGTGALASPLVLPLSALAAMLAGALFLLGPVALTVRFGVDEVVTTLLLNFIMALFVSYLLEGPLKDPMGMGWPKSP
ncbi:MAG: ABC transporter permease subunit, partial [Paracoccaceae bacterium]